MNTRTSARSGRILSTIQSPVNGTVSGAPESERSPALLAEDLLAQYVCMPAVLSELTQDVKVHPAQRERAAPVAVDHVVQPQG